MIPEVHIYDSAISGQLYASNDVECPMNNCIRSVEVMYQSIREQLLETVIKANEVDLIRLSAGNISLRTGKDLIAITPSGVKYHQMKVEDISIVDVDGILVDGLTPSSETPMHTAIYRNLPEVGGICHTHSSYAITFTMLEEEIPRQILNCPLVVPQSPWRPGPARAHHKPATSRSSCSETAPT